MLTKQENGALADKGLDGQIDAILSDFAVAAIGGFKANDEAVIEAAMREAKADLAALSAQPAGDATDAEGVDLSRSFEAVRLGYGRTHPPKPEAIAGEGVGDWTEGSHAHYRPDGPLGAVLWVCIEGSLSEEGGTVPVWSPSRGQFGADPKKLTIIRRYAPISRISQANEVEVERLIDGAAWIYAAEEFDEDRGETPEGWFAHCRRNVADGMGAVHFGDCTNQCQTCIRCLADGYLARARKALSPSPDAEGEG